METLDQAKQQGIAPWDTVVFDNEIYKVFQDKFPVAEGHLLFVPKTNNSSGITQCFAAALELGQHLVTENHCDGFNVGINWGKAAGQTVMYPHVHLIPRRSGDCEDPVGGVRGVIPGQANYRKDTYRPIDSV